MTDQDDEMIRSNVRRTVGMNALHKIGEIAAQERKEDEEKTRLLRLFMRYGWLALVALMLMALFAFRLI